jgi:hypothetical protein
MNLKKIEELLMMTANTFEYRARKEHCPLASLELRSAANALRRAGFKVGYAAQCLEGAQGLNMAPWEGPCRFGEESLQSKEKY